MKKNAHLIGHLLAIFSALVWGTTFVSSKILLKSYTPVELLLNRFLLGYLTLWIMRPKVLKLNHRRQELSFALAGLSGVTLYYLFENLSLTYTQAANASVIVSTAPLFVSIFAFFFLKEKLNRQFLLGFFFAILGIILLSFGGGSTVEMNLTGDTLCLGAALLWGIYSIVIKRIGDYGYPVILTTRRIFFYGILFMVPIAVLSGYEPKFSQLAKPVNLLNLLFLSIVACALCFVSWNKAVDILGAVKTSAYIYAIPVITLVASILILHEKVTLMMGIGTVLTILGLVVSEQKKPASENSGEQYSTTGSVSRNHSELSASE
ncbi:MAG: DMT family transporter [Eubacteriales bacterium]|nr:DMT family transporter [Eubacteriales bacterium]